MKLSDMSNEVQVVAATILASEVASRIDVVGDKRTEDAKKIAETIRVAFEELFTS